MTCPPHIPVLLSEVIQYLDPQAGYTYIDGTFGAGGYSKAALQHAECIVYGIDRDPDVKLYADRLSEETDGRLRFIHGCFSNMKELLTSYDVETVDGIILDLGVSSMQLDNGERGFSFMHNARLDMRMERDGVDAFYVVNSMKEEEIADIIYQFGDEPKARRIAKKIVQQRETAPIETTYQLASIVRSCVGYNNKKKIDPATKTFQAIRIWINDELNELTKALESAESLLKVGGKIIVVSFHSLEDRIVKNFFALKTGKNQGVSRYLPSPRQYQPSFRLLTKNAVMPSEQEIKNNVRSRSARLRAAEKLEVAA